MSDFLLLTNNEYDHTKYRSVGILSTTHVEAVSGIRVFAADILGTFGNKSELLTKKTDDAVRAAEASLIQQGKTKYENIKGICDIKFNVNALRNEDNRDFIIVHLAGTAIVPIVGGKTRKHRRA
jgi:uncharacterized protein YbjQ (UPF0145 family)